MPTMAVSRTGNLPSEVNSFVGRRQELAEIRRLFTASTLVTLTGPGGVGKTRLVVRAAAGLAKVFADGAWLAELGELTDPELMPQTVAEALGIREQTGVTSQDLLVAYLAERSLLLILDNCEHLVEESARLADVLRRSCPELRILATSREALGIQGESTLRIHPLPMPDLDRPPALKALAGFDAVSLFTDRALAAVPEFEVTDENQQAVLRIVHQLDGVPLALELAAARLRTLSPDELADRLADRYQLLTAGDRTAPARHQTLRLCVDWSYHQCTERERELWSRLSVFVGGFELDAVEGICAFGELDRSEVLDLVASLVDKSILTRVDVDERARFRMLESLRDYGLERLHGSGEYTEVRRRHRDFYTELAIRSRAEWASPAQIAWSKRLDRELPNIRAAFDFGVVAGDDALCCLRVTVSLHLYWVSRGLLTEGRRWLARALAHAADQNRAERVEALYSAVALAGLQGDLATATALLAECRRTADVLGDDLSTAIAQHAAGLIGLFTGDPVSAMANLRPAVEGFRVIGDVNRLIESLIGLSLATGFAGERDEAIGCHQEVLSITRARGETWSQAYSLWAYGLAIWRDDPRRASEMLEESLRLKVRLGDLLGSVWCLDSLACIAAAEGEPERAAVLVGASETLSRDFGNQAASFPDLVVAYQECLERARSELGERAFEAARARGGEMDLDRAAAYALGEAVRSSAAEAASQVLTPRERDVAELIAQGLTNRAIATRLVISQRTVQGHVENILAKLGFASRTQVAAWFTERS